jgi:PKD domain
MRRLRALAILASLAIAVGGAGLAKAETSAPAAQTTSGTVKCSVAPSSGTAPLHVTAQDTGSTSSGGTSISGYSFDWGDGTHTAESASKSATHTYTSSGTFEVNETIYGNFGDGHETDECAGSPVTVTKGENPPPNPCPDNAKADSKGNCPPSCSSDDENANNGEEHGRKVGEEQHENDCPPPPCPGNAKADGNGNCPPPPCPDNAKRDDHGNCPPECDEAHENNPSCKPGPEPKPKCANDGDSDADDASPPCPPPKPPPCADKEVRENGVCEFQGATFYAAEDTPMKIVVDASAVNAPSNASSNHDPIPGDKITTTDCNAPVNACNAVANLDKDTDITDYLWTFTAWRADKNNQPSFVEQHTVDSGTSPSAAVQFTSTHGDDIVQITLTITEGKEGTTVIKTPMPQFPIFQDGGTNPGVNKADLPPEFDKPATQQGNVILEPCDHGGLVTAPETIGDTLGDSGLLSDPNVNGPLTSALEDATVTTPLAGVGNEVACLVSNLTLGNL